MFSFLKPKVTIPELAERMFNGTLHANAEYDSGVLEKAKNSGHDVERFSFEYLCLRCFCTVACVSSGLPLALRDEFLDSWFARVRCYTDSLGLKQIIQTTPDGEIKAMHEWVTERVFTYWKIVIGNPHDHVLRIAATFSELCSGNPKDVWLTHIGESTFVVRGNAALEEVKSVRVRPPHGSG
jgi:hypothetical protein